MPEIPVMVTRIAKTIGSAFTFLCDRKKTNAAANKAKIIVVMVILESPKSNCKPLTNNCPAIPALSRKDNAVMIAIKNITMALIHFLVTECKIGSLFFSFPLLFFWIFSFLAMIIILYYTLLWLEK